jgi:hypothetical protein
MAELELYRRLYDFTVWCMSKTDGFPRSKRLSVGLRIEERLLDALAIVRSFGFEEATPRHLARLSAIWDEVKLILALSHDLKLISHDSFGFAIERAGEIGRLIGGFSRHTGNLARGGRAGARSSRGLVEQQRQQLPHGESEQQQPEQQEQQQRLSGGALLASS